MRKEKLAAGTISDMLGWVCGTPPRRRKSMFTTIGALALAWALGGGPAAAAPPDAPGAAAMEAAPFAEFVAPGDSLPRLRFLADGKVSLNDRCPVRLVRLNTRMGASYVNDQPVGFC
jgi:hypothetical protein